MKNLQLAEKRVDHPHGHLDVHSIFPTIQGEGPYAGAPAVFVRLAGCNLQCPGCDTLYTDGRQMMSVGQVVDAVENHIPANSNIDLVVLTGGEPLRQNCGELIQALFERGICVQIETNGTLFDLSLSTLQSDSVEFLTIVCSPKAKINHTLRPYITHLKYVGRAGYLNEKDGLPTSALDSKAVPDRPWKEFEGPIFLQPMDEGYDTQRTANNVKACIESCMKHAYVLSLQLHKIVGLP